MTHAPRYPALIRALPETVPFIGPEVMERASGVAFRARLGANESVFGPSPRAIAALRDAGAEMWKYPDPSNHALRGALAARLGVAADNIIIGAGIDGLLASIVHLMVAAGDAVVTSDGAYPTFNYHVALHGGVLHKVPFAGDHEDLDALMARAGAVDAKLVYLSNPDNPMGSWHSGATIAAALARLPAGALLVLDEAYIEFAPAGTSPDLDIEDPRLIRLRTFSKAYGMAGARVGYGLAAQPLIRAFDKVRNHFGMNLTAQAAARAALGDDDWLDEVVQRVAAAKARIAAIAQDTGLDALPSATNFVTVDCGGDGDFARAVLAGLIARGVFVRMPFVAPQDRCIRVSAGTPGDLDILAEALPQALAAARAEQNGRHAGK